MKPFNFRETKAIFFGNVYVYAKVLLYKLQISSYIYISDVQIYSSGLYPNFDLMNDYANRSDVYIYFPHFATKKQRESLFKLAKELSQNQSVMVREVAIEAGGGADPGVIGFVLENFQPTIQIIGSFLGGLGVNLIYDILKRIYKEKNNPITKSQFTIQRLNSGIRYNYVFDNLNYELAMVAAKSIPLDNHAKSISGAYQDVYLRFLPDKKKWVAIR